MKASDIFSNALDWIYPPKCMICREILIHGEEFSVCGECLENLPFISGATCKICGEPSENEICRYCEETALPPFKRNYAVFVYNDDIRNVIHAFKYSNRPFFGKGLAGLMYEHSDKNIFKNTDYIVPVPIHKKRLRERGYNQAEILANEISLKSGVSMIPDLLLRIKNTKPQNTLNIREREMNTKDAFGFNKKYNLGCKKFLIIDDIHTTGNTLKECASLLKQNRAGEINCLTLSITVEKNS